MENKQTKDITSKEAQELLFGLLNQRNESKTEDLK